MNAPDPTATAVAKWLYDRGVSSLVALDRPIQAKVVSAVAPGSYASAALAAAVDGLLRQRRAWDSRNQVEGPRIASCDACSVLDKACKVHACRVCGTRMTNPTEGTHPCCAPGDFDPLANGWELNADLEWVSPTRSAA